MKKRVLVFAVLMLFAMGTVVYAGQFGPPEPAAKEGKASLGIGYFSSSAKVKPNDTANWEESKYSQKQAYLQLGYGFTKNWEAYLRVGGADTKIKSFLDDPSITTSSRDFKDGFKPFGTIGVKGVFNISPSFGIGPFLQASLFPQL